MKPTDQTENPYKSFIVDLFRLFESGTGNKDEWEALISRDDSPVKNGIDTATGKATIMTDPEFLRRPLADPKHGDFARRLIEALEETAHIHLNKNA